MRNGSTASKVGGLAVSVLMSWILGSCWACQYMNSGGAATSALTSNASAATPRPRAGAGAETDNSIATTAATAPPIATIAAQRIVCNDAPSGSTSVR